MDPARREALLRGLDQQLQRHSAQVFRYVLDAEPYIPPGDDFFLETWRRLAPLGDDHVQLLTAGIELLGGLPGPAHLDPTLADLNYLHVRTLNRKLMTYVRDTMAMNERNLELAEGIDRLVAILQTINEDSREILAQLEALDRVPPQPPPARLKAQG
jgi:hypothetical protein